MYRRRERRRRVNPLVRGCAFLLLAIIFIAVGIVLVIDMLSFLPGSVSTTGTIVQCNAVQDADGSTTCQPVISFKTQSGQTIKFTSTDSSSTYQQGNTVTVRYHPATPQDAQIYSFSTTWLFPLIFSGLGLMLLIFGLFVWLRALIRRLL